MVQIALTLLFFINSFYIPKCGLKCLELMPLALLVKETFFLLNFCSGYAFYHFVNNKANKVYMEMSAYCLHKKS